MNPFGGYGNLLARSRAASSSQRDLGSAAIGELEAPAAIGGAVLGSVPAGLAGIASGGDPKAVQAVQERFTPVPQTRRGKERLSGAVGLLSKLAAPSEWLGSKAFEATGSPAAATATEVFADPLNFLGPAAKAAAPAVAGLGSLAYLMNRGGGRAAAGPGRAQRGMIGGYGAADAPVDAMKRAEARLAAGDDPNTVRMEEGNVFMSPDERMRFEFSDQGARFADEAVEDLDADTLRSMWRQTPEGQSLTNAMRLQEVRSRVAMPADINREFKKFTGRLPTKEEIDIADSMSTAMLRSMRDQSFDNFASTNPMRFDLGDLLEHEELYRQYPELRGTRVNWFGQEGARTRGEVDADNAINLYMPTKGPKDEARSTLLHEIQHIIQSREKHATGGSPTEFRWYGEERLGNVADALDRVAASATSPEQAKSLRAQAQTARNWQQRLAQSEGKAADMEAWRAYQQFVGELEARMTEARQGMSDVERLMVSPAESVPEAAGDVFLKFDNDQMVPVPANFRPRGSLY